MALLRFSTGLLRMGMFVVGMDLRAGEENKNGQAAAGEKVSPGICFAGGQIGFEFFPAEGRPERDAAQDTNVT